MALTKVSTAMFDTAAQSSDLNIDANTLFVDVSTNRVGIGTTSPSVPLEVSGQLKAGGILYPTSDGSNGQALVTNGSGVASFATVAPTAGTGVTVSGTTVSIGQAVATSSNVTFNNLVVAGTLTVNGATNTNSATNTTIEDILIELGTGTSGSPANDAGLVLERGSSDNVFIGWDESADTFTVGTGSFTGASSGNLTITPATAVFGGLTVDTSTLVVDASNNRVGIGNASPDVSLDIGSFTDAVHMPVGTTAQRPTGAAGYLRYNSTLNKFEGYTSSWGEIGGGGSNTFTTDVFTGDGVEDDFTLSQSVSSVNDLIVFIDGVYQVPTAAYSVSGTTLTMTAAPANTRKIVAYSVQSAISGTNLNQNSFTGNGSAVAFTLSIAPVNENNTQVFLDGVYQHKSTYATSGTTLTFDTAPASGVAIEVMVFTQTEINVPVDGTITTVKLAADAVTSAKIADDAVGNDQLASGLTLGGNTTATIIGNVTGNVTGNVSGTAATVTGAAQTSITSVGTLTALQVDNVNINGNTISTTDTNGHLVLTPNGTGNVTLNTDSAEIVGTEGEAGRLALIADEADDSGDIWSFVSNTGNTLTIENDKSGSAVSHLTITPHATVASSTVYVPGMVGIGTSAPDLTLHVDGANALPAASGTTPNGMLTLRDKTGSATHGLYMGVSNASPWGSWLQAADAGNLATEYPLLLNPNGGNVGIGTTSTDRNLHIKGSNSDVGIQIEKTGVGELRIAYDSIGPYLYDESSKPFRIYTGGGERLRLDTSGRLLIGTTSHASGYSTPGGNSGENSHYSKLWIQGNTYSTGGDGRLTLASGTAWPSTNTGIGQIFFSTAWGGDHAAISCKTDGATGNTDYPGKLVFQTTQDGTTTLAERYQIGADGTHNFYQQSAGYGDWRFGFMGAGSTYGYVGDWSTTFGNRIHLRTGSSGSIGVTTFTGSATNNFRIMQNIYYASGNYKAATTGRGTIFEQDNGAFYWVGSNSVSAGNTLSMDTLMYLQTDSGHLYIDGGLTENYNFSDLKLKTDIEELSSAIENLKKFRAVEFNWKDEKKRREHKELGVIAQEIEKVYPILVEEREKPAGENDKAEKLSPEKHLYVDYSKLTVVLLKAMQEQQTQIEALQAEVKALKGE